MATCKYVQASRKKTTAKKAANSLRASGYRARIVKMKKGYAVYSCGKKKSRR